MGYEINALKDLDTKQISQMVGYLQKLEAIDAEITKLQTEKAALESVFNKKITFLMKQKESVKTDIGAIRTITVKEI
jgi:hypothetical protein